MSVNMKKEYLLTYRHYKNSGFVQDELYHIVEAYNMIEARQLVKEYFNEYPQRCYEYKVLKLRWCGYVED